MTYIFEQRVFTDPQMNMSIVERVTRSGQRPETMCRFTTVLQITGEDDHGREVREKQAVELDADSPEEAFEALRDQMEAILEHSRSQSRQRIITPGNNGS